MYVYSANNENGFDYTFMIQNVIDWPYLGRNSCQIWFLGEVKIEEIEELWCE